MVLPAAPDHAGTRAGRVLGAPSPVPAAYGGCPAAVSAEWQAVLDRRVRSYCALGDEQKERFRQTVSVFLDEVRVTGVRTEVDDTVRVLVAAGAIIPVFGFEDWEYHRLGEVLVYPGAFDKGYQTDQAHDANILGLTGLGHLRGVVILSKPSLLAGFADAPDPENVGVHEFTHLVEQEEADGGLPPEVPPEVVRQWVGYVARELAHPSNQARRDQRLRLHERARVLRGPLRVLLRIAGGAQGEGSRPLRFAPQTVPPRPGGH